MFLKTQRRQQRNGLTGEKVLNKAIIFKNGIHIITLYS